MEKFIRFVVFVLVCYILGSPVGGCYYVCCFPIQCTQKIQATYPPKHWYQPAELQVIVIQKAVM